MLLRLKMLFLFSLDSDSIFGKIAPCQLLRLNFKNKSDFLNYDSLPDSQVPGNVFLGTHLSERIVRNVFWEHIREIGS